MNLDREKGRNQMRWGSKKRNHIGAESAAVGRVGVLAHRFVDACKRWASTPTLHFVMLAGIGISGCATKTISPERPNEVIVVPGIGGDGGVYSQIIKSLHDHGDEDCLRVCDWGSSYPIFFISIASQSWHKNVERDLAEQIVQWRTAHSNSRIVVIAHSAGAGVVAGAIARLPGS